MENNQNIEGSLTPANQENPSQTTTTQGNEGSQDAAEDVQPDIEAAPPINPSAVS